MASYSVLIIMAILLVTTLHAKETFVTRATAKMTTDVLSALAKDRQNNAIFSPFSLVIGVGMVYEGLDGVTRNEVGGALGFPSDDRTFKKVFKVKSSVF